MDIWSQFWSVIKLFENIVASFPPASLFESYGGWDGGGTEETVEPELRMEVQCLDCLRLNSTLLPYGLQA